MDKSCALNTAQQNHGSVIFPAAGIAKRFDVFHQLERVAIVSSHEISESCAAEFLVLPIQGFGDTVGVEQQAEITAEIHDVLGKFARQQAQWRAGIGVKRSYVGTVAE